MECFPPATSGWPSALRTTTKLRAYPLEMDGKILLHCFTGCKPEDICHAIGIEMHDLSQRGRRDSAPPSQQCSTATVTLASYAQAKKLPFAFLRGLGLSDFHYQGQSAVRIPYLNEEDGEVAVRFRTALEKSEGSDNRFRWKKGSKPCLYGIWRKRKLEYVVLCEGESNCHTLWHHGFPALGVPGATNWNERRDAKQFDRVPRIYVIIEPDKGGAAVQSWLAKSSIRDRAYLLSLNEFKDPSVLHLDDSACFTSRFKEAMKSALSVSGAF